MFWGLLAYLSYEFFNKSCKTFIEYKTFEKKCEFVCYWLGIVHSTLATLLSLYANYYSCENYLFGNTLLNDSKCLAHPNDINAKINLNTAGYMVYDFIIYYYFCKATGPLAY